jgi:hypothetical protein
LLFLSLLCASEHLKEEVFTSHTKLKALEYQLLELRQLLNEKERIFHVLETEKLKRTTSLPAGTHSSRSHYYGNYPYSLPHPPAYSSATSHAHSHHQHQQQYHHPTTSHHPVSFSTVQQQQQAHYGDTSQDNSQRNPPTSLQENFVPYTVRAQKRLEDIMTSSSLPVIGGSTLPSYEKSVEPTTISSRSTNWDDVNQREYDREEERIRRKREVEEEERRIERERIERLDREERYRL